MTGFRRSRLPLALAFAATLGLAAAARAEGIFRVNDPGAGNWVFDQPAVVANGTVLHLAFVGDNTTGADNASLNTRLYYAAVNGGADFRNKATTDNQVRLTLPVAIDNGDAYTDARHPQIAMRSGTEMLILFHARPEPGEDYKLFRARVNLDKNAVTFQHVDRILSATGADFLDALTDPSFVFIPADNTMRVAFSSFPSVVAGPPYSDVYYARIGADNGLVVNDPILLTTTAESAGATPLPRLKVDSNKYSHVVWAANNSLGSPTGIYYSMVHAVAPSVVDNLAIGATPVLFGGNRWEFPSLLLTSSRNVWILAADEPPSGWASGLAGSVGLTEVNPYAVTHDGNPVNVGNVSSGTNTSFFLNPPGGSVLSANFDAYQPEAVLDSLNRVQVAGYGFRDADGHGTPGRYYVMSLGTTTTGAGTTSIFATMVGSPVSVGIDNLAFAVQLPGDYTRPAFVHFSGKAINFWSGMDNVVTGARNLYVTSTFSPPDPSSQSGCSVVNRPRVGEAGRIPGAAVLLLPAVLLALRRAARKAFGRSVPAGE
jgi:hypothetical protein